MYIQHVLLHGLQTPEDHATLTAGILPLRSCVSLIAMADQQSPGNAGVAADITNVLWLTDVHHIPVMLKIIVVDKEVPAHLARDIPPLGRYLVYHSHVLVIVEGTEVLVADLAHLPDVAPPEMLSHLRNVRVRVVATLMRAPVWVLWVWDKLEDSDGPYRAITLLHVLLEGCLEERFPAFLTHLLGGSGRVIVNAF